MSGNSIGVCNKVVLENSGNSIGVCKGSVGSHVWLGE